MQLTTQVLARNTAKQVVVLSSDPKGTITVEWAASGDPSGNDLQIIPREIADTVQFIRLVQRGIVVVEQSMDVASVAESLDRQNVAYSERTQSAAERAEGLIDRTENKDILSVGCIGPNSRGSGDCGVLVTEREVTKGDKPPLCSQHIALASQYVQSEQSTPGQPGVTKVWSRYSMAPREVQHQQ